jgi:type I restriction enzyme, S subunit
MHLLNHNVHEYVKKAHGTAGLAHITKSKFENSLIRLPPLPEQHRIVNKIEELFTKLDAGVELLNKVKIQLKRYRQSALKAAFEGKLTEEWRKQNKGKIEPAEVLLERIETERSKKSNRKPKGLDPTDTLKLPELPHGWVWVTTAQLAAFEDRSMTDGPFGSNLKTEHYTSEGPRVIRLQNIGSCKFINEKAHISQDRFLKLKQHAVQGGDIVIRSLGFPSPTACIVPDWVGDAIVKADCFRYKVAKPFIKSNYVLYALNSPITQKRTEALVHGVGRPRLTLNEVKSIPLPLPPLEEQNRIANELEFRFSVMDEVLSEIESDLKRAQTLRQSILKKAFSGQLVPQDPNDEPASKLLERIKQEKLNKAQAEPKSRKTGAKPDVK